MSDMDKLIFESLWNDVEIWFDGIEDTLSHRCYPERSLVGIRAIQLDVRKHLAWIDRALIEIWSRNTDDSAKTVADSEHPPLARQPKAPA